MFLNMCANVVLDMCLDMLWDMCTDMVQMYYVVMGLHACGQACTHAGTHMQAHTDGQAHAWRSWGHKPHARVYLLAHAHAKVFAHTHAHIHPSMHARTCMHAHMRTHIRTHAQAAVFDDGLLRAELMMATEPVRDMKQQEQKWTHAAIFLLFNSWPIYCSLCKKKLELKSFRMQKRAVQIACT